MSDVPNYLKETEAAIRRDDLSQLGGVEIPALAFSVLILADCHHAVELEFSLVSPKEREESLAKIDILAEVVNRFREALHVEARAIESAKE